MTLPAGTHLGPYQITGAVGAGGMGEVYRARDTRLDRTVAIKVLAGEVKLDPALRARFEREARAVSALDHPNICVLHDVGREGDIDYIVMQYLEGETLAERLSRGPLPLDEALRYGTEIASALARAHHAGILHRDLKPGNVMLTRSHGRDLSAKLLDFGLAKVLVSPGSTRDAQPATVTSPVTGHGAILGTLLYMSPEQLEGRDVDARSDIFSFGAVLYEMVTGARAFDGPSQASVIASILEREPPALAAHAPMTPPALDRVVRKCLAKDPDRRWQSASDLCDELAWIRQSSGIQQAPGPPATRRKSISPIALGAAAMIVALAAAVVWLLFAQRTGAPDAVARTLSISTPDDVRLTPGGIAVSPDGKTVVYAAATAMTSSDGQRPTLVPRSSRLFVRRFDAAVATPLAGTEGARTPFFSPDGLSVGFFNESSLVRVALLGGAPVTITSVPPVTRGGVWLTDDSIVYTPSQSAPLLRVPSGGGKIERVVLPDMAAGEKAQMWPSALPGGGILYTIRRGTAASVDDADLAVVDPKTKQGKVVMKGAAYGQYSRTGHLLFVRGRTLMGVPFDVAKGEVTGPLFTLADEIASSPWVGGGHFTVAADGTLLLMSGSFPEARTSAVWVDRSGKPLGAPLLTQRDLGKPRISPDGTRALFDATSADGDSEIFIADLRLGTSVRFSADPQDDFNAIWTADGKRIIWTALPSGRDPSLVWRNADGTGATEELFPSDQAQFAGSVSRDGILAYAQTLGRSTDIWTMPLAGARKAQPFVTGPAHDYGPEFSPDGKWIAYVSDEGGAPDVYLVPYPGPGAKRRVTTGGGVAVAWRRDGKELVYQTTAGVMSIPVTLGSDLQFGPSRLVFGSDFVSNSREDGPREYDLNADGSRFLMIAAVPQTGVKLPTIQVLLNWWIGLSNPSRR